MFNQQMLNAIRQQIQEGKIKKEDVKDKLMTFGIKSQDIDKVFEVLADPNIEIPIPENADEIMKKAGYKPSMMQKMASKFLFKKKS